MSSAPAGFFSCSCVVRTFAAQWHCPPRDSCRRSALVRETFSVSHLVRWPRRTASVIPMNYRRGVGRRQAWVARRERLATATRGGKQLLRIQSDRWIENVAQARHHVDVVV